MECKITSTRRNNRLSAGATLIEMIMGLGVGSLVLAGIMGTSIFAARSFDAIGNYCALDAAGRNALGRMSQDVRQTDSLSSYTANTLAFQTTDPNTGAKSTLTYAYDPQAQTLTRTLGRQSTVLLNHLTYYHFDLYQRNPALTNGGDLVPLISTNQPNLVKAVDLTWICSRTVLGITFNSDDIQSARIVIRKN